MLAVVVTDVKQRRAHTTIMFRNTSHYHARLIRAQRLAAIPFHEEGECLGSAMLAVQAVLLQDTASYDKRIEKICALTEAEIKNLSVDLEAHLTNISLYQEPSAFRELFECYQAQNIFLIAEIVLPKRLQEQGGLKKPVKFSGVYTPQELQLLLQSLHQALARSNINFPVAFMMESANHAMTLGYYPNFPYWLFLEANSGATKLPKPEVTGEMVHAIFSDNSVTAFSVSVFTTGTHAEKVLPVFAEWMRSEEYLQCQNITPERVRLKDTAGGSLLYHAVKDEDAMKVAEILKLNHDNITEMTTSGINPLHLAAITKNKEILKQLLAYPEIDVNQPAKTKNNPGLTALDFVINAGDAECVRLLLNHPRIQTGNASGKMAPLYRAVLLNRESCAAELLKKKNLQINELDPFSGSTALHTAILMDHPSLVEMLLEHPLLEVNCCNKDGDTPFLKAVACNNVESVKKIMHKFPQEIQALLGKALRLAQSGRLKRMENLLQNFINFQPACASLHSHADRRAQNRGTPPH